ncbi:type II CAAX endopeptidase family protein [Chlamydia sp.]|uniref:CPBP family intramembrane glutamic endopeptidase n=1 Tax=Chlamydia sp. TaxID=35827 RepID=UPI0025C344C6|nr:type II CAAX endopeptidase family protein [Chlamydia sp.]MBQ8499026.1 CPBP family intramembrane metalloprotease [Chlamydia sp.]
MINLGLSIAFVGLSSLLSKGFFTWPNPGRLVRLPFNLVCLGVILFFLPAALPNWEPLSSISGVAFHGIFVFSAFLFLLLGLPTYITQSILHAGETSSSTPLLLAIGAGIRIWVITITITQILARLLQFIWPLVLPGLFFQEQIITEEIREQLLTRPDYLYILCVAMFIPIAEEIFFRGILQTFFKSKFSRWQAIVISSLIFAITHIEASLGSLIFVPTLFVFSLCAGFVYEKMRHIAAPITLHILFNSCQLILLSL